MADYIKRSDLIQKAEHEAESMSEPYKSTFPSLVDWLSAKIAPIDNVAPVVHGEWLPDVYAKDTKTGYEYLTLKCSVCGCGCMSRNNFCHRCGADMRTDGET